MPSSLVQVAHALGAKIGRVDASRTTPMLAERGTKKELSLANHTYELKLDGVRILAEKDGDAVRLFYRSGRETTARYPEVVAAVGALPIRRCVLDGEIVALDGEGRPSFLQLQSRMHASATAAVRLSQKEPAVFIVFDVLEVNGADVRTLPLSTRRQMHKEIVGEGGTAISRLEGVDGSGVALFEMCEERGLEGIIAKRLDSTYDAGERSIKWRKIKCTTEEDFVVIGILTGERGRNKMGSVEIAERLASGELVHRGRVGSGLNAETTKALYAMLLPLVTNEATMNLSRDRTRSWVRPEIVIRVRFTSITADGHLRHPVFRGVREPHT